MLVLYFISVQCVKILIRLIKTISYDVFIILTWHAPELYSSYCIYEKLELSFHNLINCTLVYSSVRKWNRSNP
jgi:hypothetical protein